MATYLSPKILEIKQRDQLRISVLKKHKFLDDWSHFAFDDRKLHEEHRSQTGSFYTPEWIVQLMVENALSKWIELNPDKSLINAKILEPSCGSGNFVEVLFNVLLNLIEKQHSSQRQEDILFNIASNIHAWDSNNQAVETTKRRIETKFHIDFKNASTRNTLFQNETFDIIIGNPPYGNILSKDEKVLLDDHYNNIALTFLDAGYNALNENGVLYFIVPHSFSRTGGGSTLWRKQCKENHSVFEVIDVGNPFPDITLETIIVGISKVDNFQIQTHSIREDKKGNLVNLDYFYEGKEDCMVIYWDAFYQNLKEKCSNYPFSGSRGKDIPKSKLLPTKPKGGKWHILGKNVSKNRLKHITNYDKYIESHLSCYEDNCELLVITQFGSSLKATIINTKLHHSSGGVVIIRIYNDFYDNYMSMEDAKDFLNSSFANNFLKRYILNNAELTIHLDGKYLERLPYMSPKQLEKLTLKF